MARAAGKTVAAREAAVADARAARDRELNDLEQVRAQVAEAEGKREALVDDVRAFQGNERAIADLEAEARRRDLLVARAEQSIAEAEQHLLEARAAAARAEIEGRCTARHAASTRFGTALAEVLAAETELRDERAAFAASEKAARALGVEISAASLPADADEREWPRPDTHRLRALVEFIGDGPVTPRATSVRNRERRAEQEASQVDQAARADAQFAPGLIDGKRDSFVERLPEHLREAGRARVAELRQAVRV